MKSGVSAVSLLLCALVMIFTGCGAGDKNFKYTALGDSITFGEGSTNPCAFGTVFQVPLQCKDGTSWSDRFAQALAKDKPVYYQKLGIQGIQIDGLIQRELPLIQPDVDLITLYQGTNDISATTSLYFSDPAHFESTYQDVAAKYRSVIDYLRLNFPKARIVLLNVPNLAFLTFYATRWPNLDTANALSVRFNREVVNSYKPGNLVLDLLCDPLSYDSSFLSDGLHPNDRGAQRIADKLNGVLNSTSTPAASCATYFP